MRVGVVFPGQGSQVVGMGVDAARQYPAAADCFRAARTVLGYDLLTLCEQGPDERLRETRYSQPAIFVVNVALYRAVGPALAPVVAAGHSFGELCALTIAGSMTFETALALVNERGLAMQRAADLAPGAMAAILGLSPALVHEAVNEAVAQGAGRVQLANFNAPGQIVISGDAEAVRVAGEIAADKGAKRVITLNVSGAWHSTLMDPAAAEYAPHVHAATIVPPSAMTVVSNVDAQAYGTDVERIKTNLVRSVTDEVRWHDAAVAMVAQGLDLVVEFGASAVLGPMFRRIDGAPKAISVTDAAGVEKLRAQLAPASV